MSNKLIINVLYEVHKDSWIHMESLSFLIILNSIYLIFHLYFLYISPTYFTFIFPPTISSSYLLGLYCKPFLLSILCWSIWSRDDTPKYLCQSLSSSLNLRRRKNKPSPRSYNSAKNQTIEENIK